MQFVERFRHYLGWCPNAHTAIRKLPVLHDDMAAGGSRVLGTDIPRMGWQERYRNQVFIWAVFFTMVSLPLVWIFQEADLTRLMLCLGVITGLGVFVFFGRWLWHSLGMLAKGATIKTGQKEYILAFLIAGSIPLGVILLISAMLFLIPLAGVLAFPAFATGFAYMPWYVLVLILLWERRTGYKVVFDRETGSFTATRCSENAPL